MDKIEQAYREKAQRAQTWSGLPVEQFYGPADVAGKDYERDIGDPGQYPFTRGIHRDMYRGRFWTRREVCGWGRGSETNRWLRFQLEQGITGISVVFDNGGHLGLDADHPQGRHELGVTGVSISSLQDAQDLWGDIPLDKVSTSIVESSPALTVRVAEYVTVAERQGVDIACLRGNVQNDSLHFHFCGNGISAPVDMATKLAVDVIEFLTRNVPNFYVFSVNMYDLRENGISAAQEIAFGLGNAQAYIEGSLERGLDVDSFGPRCSFYVSASIDIFEEVAKYRAMRRMWARMMREKYGAKDERTMRFKIGVHTAGSSLTFQQPLNNVVRVAYEALAAALGGVQSIHCCSYDEAISIPSEEALTLAIRTQQILAYETGVANVADPLAGSYFIESLTDRLEEEATRILQQIEGIGGMKKAIESGWVEAEIQKAAVLRRKEVDEKQRIVVGVNAFQSDGAGGTQPRTFRIPDEILQAQIATMRRLREERDNAAVRRAIEQLRRETDRGEQHNLMPAIIEAVRAYATTGEIVGTIREAWGYTYDPLDMIQSPFR
jgi:methylmalonyl-CoA mutase N-terminal domain/subunit